MQGMGGTDEAPVLRLCGACQWVRGTVVFKVQQLNCRGPGAANTPTATHTHSHTHTATHTHSLNAPRTVAFSVE